MMQTQTGDSLYEVYMGMPTEITDSIEISSAAYVGAMYEFMADWYDVNLAGFPQDSLWMCHNFNFDSTVQSDDILHGFRLYDGIRRVVHDCDEDDIDWIPLPENARPRSDESGFEDPEWRFNLNPLDNADIVNFLGTMEQFNSLNFNSIELFVDEPDEVIPHLITSTPPNGGQAIRINNTHQRFHVNSISRDFIVLPTDGIYFFHYSFVLQDPGHEIQYQPYFRAVVRDSGGNVLDERCFIADADNPNMEYTQAPSPYGLVVYSPWVCDSFNLLDYIQDTVTVEFISADCGQGLHFGYTYIANLCVPCSELPTIKLNPQGYDCPALPFEFCGVLDIDTADYTVLDLYMEITQNSDVHGIIPPSFYDPGSGVFCFLIEALDVMDLPQGGYDVFAVAILINPKGDTVTLQSLSANPNTLEEMDNDFVLGDPNCFDLDVFYECQDSTTLIVSGSINPQWYGVFLDSLYSGNVVWAGDTLSYTVEMIDSVAGYFLLEVEGVTYTEECQELWIIVPVPGPDTLAVMAEVCPDECIYTGSWVPVLRECIMDSVVMVCGVFEAPENDTAAFDLVDIILSLSNGGDTLQPEVGFTINDNVLCLSFDTIGIDTGCYDLSITLVFESPGGAYHYMSYSDLVEEPMNDLCFPLENCCPILSATFLHQGIIPFFGIESCEVDVYKINVGNIFIPAGYEFCDSLPVFEGGFMIWHEIVHHAYGFRFIAHMYITDPELYESNEGLTGTMIVCHEESGLQCPMTVHIPYEEPADGLECVCNHCTECPSPPCDYGPGDYVPITTCMFLQFPECDSCNLDPYEVEIYSMGPSGTWLHSEYFYWDSTSLEQEECFTFNYKYPGPHHPPCYRIRIISGCGDYCEDYICPGGLLAPPCETWYLQSGETGNYLKEEDELILYPNPNEGRSLYIHAPFLTTNKANVEIHSITGESTMKLELDVSGDGCSLDTGRLQTGTYLISVTDPGTGEKRYARYVHISSN